VIDWFFSIQENTRDLISKKLGDADGTWPRWLDYNLRLCLGDDYPNAEDLWKDHDRAAARAKIRALSLANMADRPNQFEDVEGQDE
jgi:hypothetical protein